MILSIAGTLDSGGPLSLHIRKSMGSVLCKIVYLRRSRPMTLSTWILMLVMPFVFSPSTGSSWVLPLVNADITSLACFRPTLSAIVNPLSAIIMSQGISLSSKPQFSVKYLSEVLPPHAWDIKEMVPCGVIPINTFIVLWFLKEENVVLVLEG